MTCLIIPLAIDILSVIPLVQDNRVFYLSRTLLVLSRRMAGNKCATKKLVNELTTLMIE